MNHSREDRLAAEVASRLAGCPDAETLERFRKDRLDTVGRRGVEEHVKACAACREALLFLERGGEVDDFPQELPPAVARRMEELLEEVGVAPSRRAVPWPTLLQVAAGLMLVAALTVGGYSLLGPSRTPSDLGSFRGDESLSLLAPSGAVTVPPNELRWIAHPDAARYRVTLLDENLEEIWSRQTSGAEPVLALDGTGSDLLIPGRNYTWRVVALDEFGATVGSSPAAHFEISPP